jgi:predicted NACHT family NTPase
MIRIYKLINQNGEKMSFENLTDLEMKLYEYIKANDFQTQKWSTREAARALHASEDDIYKALSKLSKEIRDNIWIYYENGAIRVVAE